MSVPDTRPPLSTPTAAPPEGPAPAHRDAAEAPVIAVEGLSAWYGEALALHDVSLVVAPYGRRGRAMGVVGVMGPTRMAYPHAISTVRYVRGLMNELVEHLYA